MRLCLIPLRIEPGSPAENIQRLITILDQVREQHPDLVCLPECSFTGYMYEEADLARFAEPIPGPTTAEMSRLAQVHGVYLCFGLLESTPQGVYDTALLLDRSGAIAGLHRKLSEKPPFVNGTAVDSVETEFGRLGMLVCADLFAEEVVARLDPALKLLLVPTARSFDGQSPDRVRWEKEERQSTWMQSGSQACQPPSPTPWKAVPWMPCLAARWWSVRRASCSPNRPMAATRS